MTADQDTLAVAERTGAQSQMTIDEKKAPIATDLELVPSEKNGEVEVISEADYSPVEYKTILRKIDRFLLPLMWFCYGIQQTGKQSSRKQACALFHVLPGFHSFGVLSLKEDIY